MPTLIALAVVLLVLAALHRRRWPAPSGPPPPASRSPDLRHAPHPANPTPRAVVIAPMAGPVPELDPLLAALASQDYPDYQVVVVIESLREAAAATDEVALRMAVRERSGLPPRMRVVRAGPAAGTSQKCANLLAGLAAAPAEAEVVVLVDADVLPHRHWLRDLVRGLEPAPPAPVPGTRPVLAATGFRWYVPASGPSLAQSIFSAAALGMMIDPRRTIAWGGSLAMRRRDLEALGHPRGLEPCAVRRHGGDARGASRRR